MSDSSYSGYEQGPIRPPSEAQSLLIRVTRNCPWNRCTFCPVYKERKFSRRPTAHVLRDIDSIHHYVEKLKEIPNLHSLSRQELLNRLRVPANKLNIFASACNFVVSGMRSVFLQDANSLIVNPEKLSRIAAHIRGRFPDIERITSYARASTVARLADEELDRLCKSGLNRIHIGMESGSDTVLKRVNKGCTKAALIEAGLKVKKSGIELSYYYMPGLGGKEFSSSHARESAEVLNLVQPDYIRVRALALPPGAPITRQVIEGDFIKLGEIDTCRELRDFLLQLEDIPSILRSDHILNLLIEIDGTVQGNRGRFIETANHFLALPPYDQMVFIVGRRTDRIYSVYDLANPAVYSDCEAACRRIGATPETVDTIAQRIASRYI